ncbi:hypothetical protein CEXT_369801 [Caerostris extrusa]|uniref:Uncharacterized protein n=1 Tax=Caerostris extrusa TaxID=172846 RepID=A0AAV4UNX6_CAEEX|nr:hypothetical protein CEXT_369801 [Caerostris extrusa]
MPRRGSSSSVRVIHRGFFRPQYDLRFCLLSQIRAVCSEKSSFAENRRIVELRSFSLVDFRRPIQTSFTPPPLPRRRYPKFGYSQTRSRLSVSTHKPTAPGHGKDYTQISQAILC